MNRIIVGLILLIALLKAILKYLPTINVKVIMSKRDKLIQKFLGRPPSVRFDEVEAILKLFGFEQARANGSHHTFRRSRDGLKITVPKKGGQIVKRTYIIKIIDLLDLENIQGE